MSSQKLVAENPAAENCTLTELKKTDSHRFGNKMAQGRVEFLSLPVLTECSVRREPFNQRCIIFRMSDSYEWNSQKKVVLSFALWNISEIFILASGNQEGATLAAQILYRIIFIIPAIYVVSAYHFPRDVSSVTNSAVFYAAVFIIPMEFLVSSFPHFHIELISLSKSGTVYFYRIVTHRDFQSISLLATFFLYLVWGLLVMVRKIPRLAHDNKKLRRIRDIYVTQH